MKFKLMYVKGSKGMITDPSKQNAIGNALEDIRHENKGSITPAAVLKAAQSKSSPLHDCFEWNNGEAASRFRYFQACMVISSVRVKYKNQKEPMKYFVSVRIPHTHNREYFPVKTAMANTEMRDGILKEAVWRLKAIKTKYDHLTELSTVMDAIDELDEIG